MIQRLHTIAINKCLSKLIKLSNTKSIDEWVILLWPSTFAMCNKYSNQN